MKKIIINWLTHGISPQDKRRKVRHAIRELLERSRKDGEVAESLDKSQYMKTGIDFPSIKGKYYYRSPEFDINSPLVFTSCTNNYLPKARVLASSLKKYHPDWEFCLLLGEAPPEGFDLTQEPFDSLILFEDLEMPNYWEWLFRHRVVEICTAAKGHALYHFAVKEKRAKVFYLDPDIMVCHSLQELSDLLDQHDILLCPHQLAPVATEQIQAVVDNEFCSLKYGVFNLGFVAIAARDQGIEFATWWRDRLHSYCYDDIPNGIFTDQRVCDLAPCFFSNLHIVRDPGCDAASWNLTDRTITKGTNGYMANESPLKFYHFTGYDSGAGKIMTQRYGGNMPAVGELWKEYGVLLEQMGHSELKKSKWAYLNFPDGLEITDQMRLVLRENPHLKEIYPNPFSISSSDHYRAWFVRNFLQ